MSAFKEDLKDLINSHSKENGSDTPDFILAQYLDRCLDNFVETVSSREAWYGRNRRPVQPPPEGGAA